MRLRNHFFSEIGFKIGFNKKTQKSTQLRFNMSDVET